MPEFVRSFDVDRLAEWDARHPGNAVRALFARWAVPGHVGTPKASLRLGLRKNYVNFYVSGQSVAKLSCGQRDLKVSVHEAYATGRARRSGDPPERPPTKNYVDYDGEALARAETADSIARWVTTAETYANAEKRFVDRLVEANPGVIDLEMGLPAGDVTQGKKSAPRMDLVLVQPAPADSVAIAFWEAKCSINSELRADAEYQETPEGERRAGPKVIHQLRKYERWMHEDGRLGQVQHAYRAAAAILLGFYENFGLKASSKPVCIGMWEKLAAARSPRVILPPGVAIGNYCPPGHKPSKPGEALDFERRSESFQKHRDKLERHGIPVHEVGAAPEGHGLPLLGAGVVSA